MKNKLRRLMNVLTALPIAGRFLRIVIAIIRLPEERIQFKQHMTEHIIRMQRQEDALCAATERLAQHDAFIGTQIPRLAQKVAELYRPHTHNN